MGSSNVLAKCGGRGCVIVLLLGFSLLARLRTLHVLLSTPTLHSGCDRVARACWSWVVPFPQVGLALKNLNSLSPGEIVSPRAGLVKKRVFWHISKMVPSYFLLKEGNTRGFFSNIQCENQIKILEVKLTKV